MPVARIGLAPAVDMVTPTKAPINDDDLRNSKGQEEDVLSPLSRSRWDSPPSGNNTINRSTPPSQRKLIYGLDEPENVGNDKHSKKKCKRGTAEKETKPTATVAFSDNFPESESSTDKMGSCKSLHLGPRLSRCQQSLPSIDGSIPTEAATSSSTCDSTSAAKLPPKSPPKSSPKQPKLSPRKSLSPLRPPRNFRAANNDINYFNDFTLTPTVLYNNEGHYNRHRPLTAPMSCQHFHQSPHWSGQVRVNPFSPVPEQYLHHPPPTSTKSATRGNNKRKHQFLIDIDSPTLALTSLEQIPPTKKARLSPIRLTRATARAASSAPPQPDDDNQGLFNEISPTGGVFGANSFGTKRKAEDMMKPPPQCNNPDAQQNNSHKRMRVKRGRYLDDFEEIRFLGAGSFGSVNACLSRLDGCMYAVKSISPKGQKKKGNESIGQTGVEGDGYLYGGRKMMSNQCIVPPTPTISPLRRRKSMRRFSLNVDESAELGDDYDEQLPLNGSGHWHDGALRRMLREVFALAALCQQDDFRTFHIVRYQQAWLEDDGMLYIQTELCSATLRDEMSRKVIDGNGVALGTDSNASSGQAVGVFRQLKILREVLLALELLHEKGIVHLDIKPDNVFIKNNIYKLGDFGLANVFTQDGERSAGVPDIEEGDSRYMSKDLLDFNPKDLTKCDIFSLGATMYEVISGRPLPSCGQEWHDLRNGKLSPLQSPLNAIIKEMMHPDSTKRPSATDLLSREALRCEDDNPLRERTARKRASYKPVSSSKVNQQLLKRPRSWSL